MTMSRDDKFKLAFDIFVKESIGVDNYEINNTTVNRYLRKHTYHFLIKEQSRVIGFIDRDGVNHIGEDLVNMDISTDRELIKDEYIPNKEEFEKQFNEVFDKYKETVVIPISARPRKSYTYHNSYVVITESNINDDGTLEGKLAVVYHKQHIPYYVETNDNKYAIKYSTLLSKYNETNKELNLALVDIDEMQDDLLYNERQLRITKKIYFRETKHNKISEMNLINKLRDIYNNTSTKEECPVCYDKIENDKLIIPRCSHYICSDCHPRCSSCPICRIDYPA